METVARVSAAIQAEYGAWFRRNGELAGVMEAELHDELIRRDGQPEAAHFVPDAVPPCWVRRFSGNTVVRYTLTEEAVSGWLFGKRRRKVVIIGIGPPT